MADTTYLDSRRNPAGLAVTLALHAGIAAVGLFAVTTTIVRETPKPIITEAIPDPVTAKPVITPPVTRDPVIQPVITEPVWTEAPIVTIDGPRDSPRGEPVVVGGGDVAPITIDPIIADPGPTVPARFDPRHAGGLQPPYPTASRRIGEEGDVVVHVRIGRDGRVLAASLARSSGSARLDDAAVRHALANWRFSPALTDGAAVEAARDITVRFRLAEAAA